MLRAKNQITFNIAKRSLYWFTYLL